MQGLSRPTQAAYRLKHQDRMIPTAIIARVTSIQFWTVPPKIVKCRTSRSSIEVPANAMLQRSADAELTGRSPKRGQSSPATTRQRAAINLPTPCRHQGFLGIRGGPYSGGRRVAENGFFTSGNRSGSGTSQSMQRNLRPPVFTSTKCMGLWHFGQEGGGGFLGMWTLTLDQAGAQHSVAAASSPATPIPSDHALSYFGRSR
jgi:hypothetical protein